jgi:hypothetical protein
MHLTKSQFLTYLESPLHLWLSVHSTVQPKPPSLFEQHTLQQGYAVEKLAKEFLTSRVKAQYPAGTTLEFEVTLTDGNYESRIDALVHDTTRNTYDLYEIKSSTSIHSRYTFDVTFQYLVGKATLPINKVYLVRVNKDYRRAGEIDPDELFVVEDMAEAIALKEAEVYEKRTEAWGVLRQDRKPSEDHCLHPTRCVYPSECFPDLPDGSIYELSNGTKKLYGELLDQGVQLIKDIPATFVTNYKQRLQIQAAKTGKPIIDRAGIQRELEQLQFPLYFLDYEAYAEALPLFDGYRPYQQAVTQFSLHVVREVPSIETTETPETEVEHYEYLATEPGDPARQLATKLCEVIGDTGSVVVWYKNYECSRNAELAELCPELAEQLRGINARVFDLMELFSESLYVDHRFKGSASIKKVLPVLCPELSYKELEIGEGTKAMLAWHEMVYGGVSEDEVVAGGGVDGAAKTEVALQKKERIKLNLLEYCKLDTWAMVEIWRKVREA